MVNHYFTSMLALALSFVLSACVTQNFENGETPVVQNQSSRDDMAATRIALGLGYLKMGNMPQAKQNLEKAKKFAPEMVQVYTAFAHYYETVGEHTLTIDSYEQALALKSDDADTLNNYGVYLCRQKQIEAAETQLLKAIAVPSYLLVAKSYENLSACFLQEDDFEKAETYLSKAILHSSSSASTLFQMVQLQYAMGDYEQAKYFEQRFEKVTRRFTPQSLALAFKVYAKLGQQRTAKNYGTMLVKMYPQSWESQQYLLNELEQIEADNLAKRYQLAQADTQASQPKKRVVKLSPKKPTVKTIAEKTEPLTVTEQAAPLALQSSSSAMAVARGSQASVQMVNDALSMAIPKEEKKVIVATDDKQAVVEHTESTAQRQAITAAVTEPTSAISVASQADTEIFNVAKKPAAIIEEPVSTATSPTSNPANDQQPPTEVEEQQLDNNVAQAKTAELEKAVEQVLQPPVVAKPAVHIVAKGDTLYSISVKYNVKISALQRWNELSKKRKIRINDKLFIENPAVGEQK